MRNDKRLVEAMKKRESRERENGMERLKHVLGLYAYSGTVCFYGESTFETSESMSEYFRSTSDFACSSSESFSSEYALTICLCHVWSTFVFVTMLGMQLDSIFEWHRYDPRTSDADLGPYGCTLTYSCFMAECKL